MSNRDKIYPFPTNEKIDVEFPIVRSKSNDDGGGGDMSKYVTKEELRTGLELLESKIDNKFLELKLELKNQQTSNIKWIVGTAIALASVIIAAIKLL
ncbi:hypothetical protein ABQD97_22005 [Enterococcus avium]|uniref:Uncharacterized protein n=1 Tax=Enterococcus avium TaxID=33945 RepID=A0ABD5FA19_ENTAV|nr:hypothetical protein [Enterococcus avium]MDT2397615.1 hypothetical protein [Enterococcus avium]MDT2488670.1 hypothetical protein [Enterococcus avium]MDT2514656.1 hypothetical protein [Enterococcus avium]MDT2520548.1 hypothetical protein [Enterococcus avium]